jgi:hypothetical protein
LEQSPESIPGFLFSARLLAGAATFNLAADAS